MRGSALPDFSARQLEAVLALVEYGSFVAAAARLRISQPALTRSVKRLETELGLIDEYRIYLHPIVLGHGKPYFAGARPPLRLMTNDRIGEDVVRLTYVPA